MSEWWSPADVAREVGCHVTTVWLALEAGELHGHQRKRGARWRISPAAVDAWIRELDGETACGCRAVRLVKRSA